MGFNSAFKGLNQDSSSLRTIPKQSHREAGYSPASNVEIKNAGNWFRDTWGRQYEIDMSG